jgi:hypothetical protein
VSSHSVKRRSVARPATATRVRPTAKTSVVATARPAQSKRPQSVSIPATPASPHVTTTMTVALAETDGSLVSKADIIRQKALAQRDRFLDSLESVQGKDHDAKSRPRWFKMMTWFLVLMPLYSVAIYGIGYLYFHANENVDLQTSFLVTPITRSGNVLVPDQNGAFLQTGTGTQQKLNLINQFPDRSLQPPTSAQVVLKSADLRYVLVRDAQLYMPDEYPVYRIQDGKNDVLMNVTATRLNVPGVAVVAITMPNGQAWAPGEYMIDIPIPDDEGDTYSFFTIQT